MQIGQCHGSPICIMSNLQLTLVGSPLLEVSGALFSTFCCRLTLFYFLHLHHSSLLASNIQCKKVHGSRICFHFALQDSFSHHILCISYYLITYWRRREHAPAKAVAKGKVALQADILSQLGQRLQDLNLKYYTQACLS